MKQFLRSLPLFNVPLMLLQIATGILSIPIAIAAALLFEPVANAPYSAAGLGSAAILALLFGLFASLRVGTEEKGRLETAGYMCTMAAVWFLGAFILGEGIPRIADVDQNASTIASWLSKALWYIAVLYIETGCLLFCWTVDMFVKKPVE